MLSDLFPLVVRIMRLLIGLCVLDNALCHLLWAVALGKEGDGASARYGLHQLIANQGRRKSPHHPTQTGDMEMLKRIRMHGNVSGLWGNVTGLRGDVTGLTGDVTGLTGDLDDCGITDEQRNKGVEVNSLIEDE